MAAIRVIVILFALSPIFVGLTLGSIYWLRGRPRQQQNRLRELEELHKETQDSRDWQRLYNDLEQRTIRSGHHQERKYPL